MDRRTCLFLALACFFATIVTFACSGANGDPAPVPVEAGEASSAVPCTDGATE